jgi:hypothetical protein
MRIKHYLFLCALSATCTPLHAALAPQYQNAKDLDVMVSYVKQHDRVLATLRSISMRAYVIHFGDDCKVQFARAPSKSTAPGPAPNLVFESASCPVD